MYHLIFAMGATIILSKFWSYFLIRKVQQETHPSSSSWSIGPVNFFGFVMVLNLTHANIELDSSASGT